MYKLFKQFAEHGKAHRVSDTYNLTLGEKKHLENKITNFAEHGYEFLNFGQFKILLGKPPWLKQTENILDLTPPLFIELTDSRLLNEVIKLAERFDFELEPQEGSLYKIKGVRAS